MVAVARFGGQLYGHGGAAVSPPRSAVGGRDPGDAAKADPFIGEFSRLLFARLAVDAVRVDFAIMDTPGFFGKSVADVIAMGLDLLPNLTQRRAKLRRRDRRRGLSRAAEARRHHRFLDRSLTAF